MANGAEILEDLFKAYYTPIGTRSQDEITDELRKFGERSLYYQLGYKLVDLPYLTVANSQTIDTIGNNRMGGVYNIRLNGGNLSRVESDLEEVLNPLKKGKNFLLYVAVTRLVEVKFFNPDEVDFEVEKTEYGLERVMIRKAD
jgi:hypothetical protein